MSNFKINRRAAIVLGSSGILFPNLIRANAPWATLYQHNVSSPGAVFNLPEVNESLGIMDCAGVNALAQKYRAACAGLNDIQLTDIQTRLERITQQEVYKLQVSIDLQDPKKVAAWMGILDGIVTAGLGLVVIGALVYGAPVVLAGASAAALIYGLGVSPTISIVKASLDDPSGGKILTAWVDGRFKAVAIEAAGEAASNAGKQALKTLAQAAAASYDVFSGIKNVIEGSSDLSLLEQTMQTAAARVLELDSGFRSILSDRDDLRNMLCATATVTAEGLERYAAANAGTDCRPGSLEIQNIQFQESGTIIRA